MSAPEPSPAQVFANTMFMVVADSALGAFDHNLWGLAIATDHGAQAVEARLWFETEPTMLDRGEMGEFASAFDAYTDGRVVLDLRWTTQPQAEHGPVDRTLQWVHLRRSPLTDPDTFAEADLRY